MKNFLLTLIVATVLGGCAQLQNLQSAFTTLANTTVSSQTALVTANSYDALEAGADVYLSFCKANLTQTVCSAANRRAVIKNVQIGRALRNQIEGYTTTSTSVPIAVYNALETIVTNLGSTPAASFKNGATP